MNTVVENGVLVRCGGEKADVLLEEGITKIASGAFKGLCLRSIELPRSLEALEDGALAGCGSPEILYNGAKEDLARVSFGQNNPSPASVWTLVE